MILRPKKNSIHDDYFVTDQVLGKGDNRPVVVCINKKTSVKYALKVLEDTAASRSEISIHWKSSLNSQFIVKIADLYECVRSRKKYFLLVLEYMEGGELFNNILKRLRPFTEQQVAKIMYQICSAIRDLHDRNIAHRDLKLDNILLTTAASSSDPVIKLTDFGHAREASAHETTQAYSVAYASSDSLHADRLNNNRYDLACDIWSLGVILFILCFGFAPFQNCDSLDSVDFDREGCSFVSHEAKSLVCAMLTKTPEKRIKIRDIMASPWICNWSSVAETKLVALSVLKRNVENWPKVQVEYGIALENMRIVGDEKALDCDEHLEERSKGSVTKKSGRIGV